jgi:hypothetical protein
VFFRVTTTSSKLGGQFPFDIVHRKILIPTPRAETPVDGLPGLASVPEPETTVQIPVPVPGAFPTRV